MSENEIKSIISIAARNIAVALVNNDELVVVTMSHEKGTGRVMDVMDVVERIVKEQLEGSLIVGPGGDGTEDDIEQARRQR